MSNWPLRQFQRRLNKNSWWLQAGENIKIYHIVTKINVLVYYFKGTVEKAELGGHSVSAGPGVFTYFT